MNKTELAGTIAEKAGLGKKDANAAVDAFMDIVKKEVANGGSVQLIGFGTFEAVERAQRTGKNPSTGEDMVVPAKRVPKFKPGKSFKQAVEAD